MNFGEAKFIRGRNGGEQLIHDGYSYTKFKARQVTTSWECCARSHSCRAKLLTDNQSRKILRIGNHNHKPDEVDCEIRELRSAVVQQLESNHNLRTAQLSRGTLAKASREAATRMPAKEHIGRSLRYRHIIID